VRSTVYEALRDGGRCGRRCPAGLAAHIVESARGGAGSVGERLQKYSSFGRFLPDEEYAAATHDFAICRISNSRLERRRSSTSFKLAADFRKLIADETEKWAKVIKFAGIKAD
jgi:hypothetical protein